MAKAPRSPQDAANNYANNTANAQPFWLSRTQNADWKSGAGSPQAEANFGAAMTKVVQNKSRQAGVNLSSNAVFSSGVQANAGRYTTGTAAAQPKVLSVMGKLLPDINAAVQALPPRGPRGSQSNIMQRGTGVQTKLAANRGKYKATGIAKSVG